MRGRQSRRGSLHLQKAGFLRTYPVGWPECAENSICRCGFPFFLPSPGAHFSFLKESQMTGHVALMRPLSEILGWPKCSFWFFCVILWKNQNKRFGQPKISGLKECKVYRRINLSFLTDGHGHKTHLFTPLNLESLNAPKSSPKVPDSIVNPTWSTVYFTYSPALSSRV